jgi:branched-chain amino acid transport system ATP-binding protein
MMGRVILEARELRKEFSGFVAVDGVSLEVDEGTVHALIGPNGAGKTTTFNLLTKFMDLTSGSISFRGQDITRMPPAKIAKLGIVRSFQISAIFPSLTLRENLLIALQLHTHQSFAFWRPSKIDARMNDRISELLDQVGLLQEAGNIAGDVSYGKRRALEIATTLALDPAVLLLDEPMSGLGGEDIQRISRIIQSFKGIKTVLMVEHNLSVVASLSDKITVLARGQKIAEGTYAQVSANPEVQTAYIGNALVVEHV